MFGYQGPRDERCHSAQIFVCLCESILIVNQRTVKYSSFSFVYKIVFFNFDKSLKLVSMLGVHLVCKSGELSYGHESPYR